MKKLTEKDIPYLCSAAELIALQDGYTVSVRLEHDSDHGAPWEECDGHGEVSAWERRDKRPGELVLCEDRGSKRFYDFAGAVKLARRDGWDTAPYKQGTKGERAERAARADFEFLRLWCTDQWSYVGVIITLERNGAEVDTGDCWGIETYKDYPREHAADTINGMVASHIAARKIAARRKGRETRERNHWAARGMVTA